MEADKAKEEAKYNSQSVTVITKEDIARKQGKSVEDVIFNEVGVTRTVDAMGKVGISIRGADPRHTLIMVDGQPVLGDVSKYSGNGDELMRIGAENIERIEIIRGAASAKYGADAIGGVVNVITKVPKDNAGIEFNAEGRYHRSRYSSPYESSALPSNFYLRADTGKIGNFKVAVWTSKRDILPVYGKDKVIQSQGQTIVNWQQGVNWFENLKPSLRYYGRESSSGVSGSYEFNTNNTLDFRVTHDDEDVKQLNKIIQDPSFAISFMEPLREFHRTMRRDNYNFTYTGRGGKTDWKVDFNYGKIREDNFTILSKIGKGYDAYSGYNILGGVDWLEHRRTNINANFNTAVNDQHFMSYGVGYTKETAEGSRLKNAPKHHPVTIDPWDYDKSLYVSDYSTNKGESQVHNFLLKQDEDTKKFYWDHDREYYGFIDGAANIPNLRYEDMAAMLKKYPNLVYGNPDWVPNMDANDKAAYHTFMQKLSVGIDQKTLSAINAIWKDNTGMHTTFTTAELPLLYYGLYGGKALPAGGEAALDEIRKLIPFNGIYYKQEFDERENQLEIGEAELKKTYAYVQDNWQITANTMITPSLRIDHSNLFGSQVTGNMGLLHNLQGNPHRRLKANVGTGYAEPGLGELYYNWEMYGGTGMDQLGWYWVGNPNLKPEKSLNFDVSIEGESNKTFAKLSLFHNEIKDYMSSYFTGQLIDFNFKDGQYVQTPDRIYSFKNLGKAKITGLEAEVQQKFNDHWSAKLGYTWLHAINDSDEDMPDKLLDKPTHKFDISFNYKNTKGDFRGALWGSYYVNMLDSNSVDINADSWKNESGVYTKQPVHYKEKSFGVWNLLLEKDFGKDLTTYVGVDNLFDHRDDDRAFQDRVYRFGVNIKLADLGETLSQPFHIRKDADGNPIITNVYGDDWFLSRPVDVNRKAGDVDLYGEYQVRSNMVKGGDKSGMRETKTTQASAEAARNYVDKPDHGLEQRLRLGVDYQIADGLNLDVAGSTAKRDTSYNVADKRGLHDPYLEKAELTKSTKKWDWSVGRISEPLGVTGYWFGKEYDGARVVYTDDKTQVSLGYGDFSQTTGITDSAYNHAELATIYRAPTLNELFGLYNSSESREGDVIAGTLYPMSFDSNAKANYQEKYNAAGCVQDAGTGKWIPDPKLTKEQVAEAKLAVCRELVGILRNVDAELKRRGYENALNPDYRGGFDQQIQKVDKFMNFANVDVRIQFINKTSGKMETIDSFSGGENMVNAGISLKLGQGNHVSTSRVAMATEIKDLRNVVKNLILQVNELTKSSGGRLEHNERKADFNTVFPDVPENHWAYEYIKELGEQGLIQGYPDGEFKGNRAMTRYEFATMLARAIQAGLNLQSNANGAQLLYEFTPELTALRNESFRIDRISGKDTDKAKVNRIRVNNTEKNRDIYGSILSDNK